MTTLIGINGFKTSGKDTTYRFVAEMCEGVQRIAFADKLKIMAGRALGLSEQGYHDDEILELMDAIKEHGWVEVAIPLDEAQRVKFGVPSGRTGASSRISGREYLQYFGAHARDVFGDTFWIDQILPNPNAVDGWAEAKGELFQRAYPGDGIVCVTDVRYPNEAQRVRDLGGVMWEVQRPGLASDGHSSETPLPRHLVDTVILNDGDLDTLYERVSAALGELGR